MLSGITHKMFAANATKIYDVTTTTPVLVKDGQTSGNYVASQLANAAGDWMIVLNDAGDPPLRFDGTTWATLAVTTPAAWTNGVSYAIGARALDTDHSYWVCAVAHTAAAAGTFAADRAANPSYWTEESAPDGVSGSRALLGRQSRPARISLTFASIAIAGFSSN